MYRIFKNILGDKYKMFLFLLMNFKKKIEEPLLLSIIPL